MEKNEFNQFIHLSKLNCDTFLNEKHPTYELFLSKSVFINSQLAGKFLKTNLGWGDLMNALIIKQSNMLHKI